MTTIQLADFVFISKYMYNCIINLNQINIITQQQQQQNNPDSKMHHDT